MQNDGALKSVYLNYKVNKTTLPVTNLNMNKGKIHEMGLSPIIEVKFKETIYSRHFCKYARLCIFNANSHSSSIISDFVTHKLNKFN